MAVRICSTSRMYISHSLSVSENGVYGDSRPKSGSLSKTKCMAGGVTNSLRGSCSLVSSPLF